jgi:adenylate kinase
MPLIFVGGARGTGKTTLIKALKATYPHVEHVGLAQEVNTITATFAFHDEYVGMRRLTPDQQHAAVSKVLKRLAQKNQEDPSRIIFIDGHYVSTSYVDNHSTFVPTLGEDARLLAKMIWIKIEPHQILYRRFKRERIARPLDLTVREYFAEGLEAQLLARQSGTQLLKCRDDNFFDVIYTHFDRFLNREAESKSSASRMKVAAVLRLIRGDTPDKVSQELGVTVETLSRWLQRFVEAGSAGLEAEQQTTRVQEISRLKALVGKMVNSSNPVPESVEHPVATKRPFHIRISGV